VLHTCNPSYSGGRDQEDQGSKPAQMKKLVSSDLKKQAGVVAYSCNKSYSKRLQVGESWSDAGLGQKCETLFKN
jgi:hypothetical protein